MKKYILIILIFSFLQSCSSVSEGFKLKKGNTGDEFLVEKKSPLVMPPNYGELPVPDTNSNDSNQNTDKNKIQEQVGGRKDYKIDCLAADFKDWEVSWNKKR